MKNLVIVESPAKSKTIEKYLGKDYEVLSSVGHIRDLATTGKLGLGVDVDGDFQPTYKNAKGKADVIKKLKAAVKTADHVYLATDPDREGEAISWHLADLLSLPTDEDNRVVFNEITPTAVKKAFESPRPIDMHLVHSQETRRILDRIIGFRLSKLLQNKIKSKSAGRVQSVALKLVVDREREIEAFIPKEYWEIHAYFMDETIKAKLTKHSGKKIELNNEAEASVVVDAVNGNAFTIDSIAKKRNKRSPKLPFITSSLQQEAANKLGFSAKRTMSIAQKLYEGIALENEQVGLITYMRTDSTRLSDDFVTATKDYVLETFGKEYSGTVRKTKEKANTQDAHEAIRPTAITRTPEEVAPYLDKDELKLYSFIWARSLAFLMKEAQFDNTKVIFENNGYEFQASGSVLVFDGYLKVYSQYETNKNEILPELTEGEKMDANKIEPSQHFTQPPARYSEASLVKELEEQGIGRPSTYASILDTIQKRAYVELREKRFYPTDQGILTNDKLQEQFNNIINNEYTAHMEQDLDKIAEGNEDHIQFLKDFYAQFEPMVLKAFDEMEKIAPQETGEMCPLCGKPLVVRRGRYGEFVGCSGYPECKYIKPTEKNEPQSIGVPCPKCGEGEIVEKKTRRGKIFYGCNRYPDCDFALWDKPTGEKCPKCDSLMVQKGKKIKCSSCDYVEGEEE